MDVARCTVERLMRKAGLRGVMCGKGARTTVANAKAPCPLKASTISTGRSGRAVPLPCPWNTSEAVELATLELVSWLNHHCQLERLGYIPLAEAEANYCKQLSSQAIPA